MESSLTSRSEMIAYRSNVLQALEELRLKRDETIQRQAAAEKLLVEKLSAEQNLEATSERLKQADLNVSILRSKLEEMSSKALESKYKEENQQLKIALEAAENTVAMLKKEIGMISIQRHQLEATLKQSEQKAAASNARMAGLNERLHCIEVASEKISKQLDEYEETQALLRKNADSATAINRDLVKSRTYAEYLFNKSKEEIEALKHKLIVSEASCKWTENSTCMSKAEAILQNEVEEFKRKIGFLEKKSRDDVDHHEKLSNNLKETQERLESAHKLIACCTCDDKSVIDLENKLKESENCNRIAEEKLLSISEDLKKVKIEKGIEIARSAEQITSLESQVKEFTCKENDWQRNIKELKEAKLTIQEMKIKLDAANQRNCCQAIDLEQRGKIISEYKSELEKVKSNAPVTKDSDCQTDNKDFLLDQQCQTECNVTSVSRCAEEKTDPIIHDTKDGMYVEQQLENTSKRLPDTDNCEKLPTSIQATENLARSVACSPNGHRLSDTTSNGSLLCQFALSTAIADLNTDQSLNSLQDNIECTAVAKTHERPPDTGSIDEMKGLKSVKDFDGDLETDSNDKNGVVEFCDLDGEDIIASSSQEDTVFEDTSTVARRDSPKRSRTNFEIAKDQPYSFENVLTTVENSYGKFTTPKRKPLENCVKTHVKKRKLTSSPIMLELSQSSCVGDSDSDYPVSKLAPLRSLKNFSKQVFSSKPIAQPKSRFNPLSLVSGLSGSLKITSKSTTRKIVPNLYRCADLSAALKSTSVTRDSPISDYVLDPHQATSD